MPEKEESYSEFEAKDEYYDRLEEKDKFISLDEI